MTTVRFFTISSVVFALGLFALGVGLGVSAANNIGQADVGQSISDKDMMCDVSNSMQAPVVSASSEFKDAVNVTNNNNDSGRLHLYMRYSFPEEDVTSDWVNYGGDIVSEDIIIPVEADNIVVESVFKYGKDCSWYNIYNLS